LPYGETWIEETTSDSLEEHSPKFNSQELDKETGYYFYNARHYDGEIGRFVTADTVIDGEFSAKGWNLFMYVGGNPIRYKDPTGHVWNETQHLKNHNQLKNEETTTVNSSNPSSANNQNNDSQQFNSGNYIRNYAMNKANQGIPTLTHTPLHDSIKNSVEKNLLSNNLSESQRARLTYVKNNLGSFTQIACATASLYGQLSELSLSNQQALNSSDTYNSKIESDVGDYIVRGILDNNISKYGVILSTDGILSNYKINGKNIIPYRITKAQGAYEKLVNNEIPTTVTVVRIHKGPVPDDGHNQLLYRKKNSWVRADPGRYAPTYHRSTMNETHGVSDTNNITT